MPRYPPNYRHCSEKIEGTQIDRACYSCVFLKQFFSELACLNYYASVNLYGVCDSWVEDRSNLADRLVTEGESKVLRFREPLTDLRMTPPR